MNPWARMRDQRALTDELSMNALQPGTEEGVDNFTNFLDAHPEYIPNDLRKNVPADVREYMLRPVPGKIRVNPLPMQTTVDPDTVAALERPRYPTFEKRK